MKWSINSWQDFPIKQFPEYSDKAKLLETEKELAKRPPLVFAEEVRRLRRRLAFVAEGKSFLLQGGDCAESFLEHNANNIRDSFKVILQMAAVLTFGSSLPVVKIGRFAGQYSKPRSSPVEVIDGVELPSYKGDMINDMAFDKVSREPDPTRLLKAYDKSASTLNLLRAFTKGGFAALSRVHQWNREFVAASPAGQRYEALADEIDRAVSFMHACGIDGDQLSELSEVNFHTSHEALILGYEEALTREDSITGEWYDCSAHMLWIGERTRELDGAHVEFLRGVKNPIGCKIGPEIEPEDAVKLCEILNPEKIPGRLTLISRMGADVVIDKLPRVLETVNNAEHPVVWVCDPMHGNTFSTQNGHKTRHFDDVLKEITGFFEAHKKVGTNPGGVHLELTGDDVTECLGGGSELDADDLSKRYETMCDPRLNGSQSIDIAFRIAELLHKN